VPTQVMHGEKAMAEQKKQCPDCRADMVEGFILDMTYGVS
jgi:hypothetical protein